MIWVALVLLVVSGTLLWMSRTRADAAALGFSQFQFTRAAALGPAFAGVLLFVLSWFAVVPAGHVGVQVLFGSVRHGVLREGLRMVNPFARVEKLSVRTMDYTMVTSVHEGQRVGDDSVFVQSSDGVRMLLDITVAYRLIDNDAPWVFRHLGRHYAESIVRPASRSAVPEVASRYTFQQAYAARREELGERMRQHLSSKIRDLCAQYPDFPGNGIAIQSVFVRKVEPDMEVMRAIQEKMKAEQESLRMDFIISRERKEKERKQIEAEGIQKFQEIVTQGISEKLLQWKGIEATETLVRSPNSKIIVIGGKGGLPLVFNAP